MRNFMVCTATQYCSGDQIKKNAMSGARNTYGETKGAYRVLVMKPEEKKPFGRPRRRWEENIKMDLQEAACEDMDWIDPAVKMNR
jgi:hypothetical protein